jgi:P27 family predicted phage terminase small subunit
MRGDRPSRINTDEPQPLIGQPITKPAGLSPRAAEEWGRVAPHLAHMGVLSAADVAGLACYCEAVARWRVLAAVVADAPPLIDGAEGHLVKNPTYSMMRDASAEVLKWAREFGLTPSARSGIHVHHHLPDANDPARLLSLPEAGPG